jgi:hypothetical protein
MLRPSANPAVIALPRVIDAMNSEKIFDQVLQIFPSVHEALAVR